MGDRLKGQVALITGGGNGIGRQTALLFASEGAQLIITDKIEAAAEETRRLIIEAGGQAAAISADVTQAAEVEASIKFAQQTFGKLQILINNAGLINKPARLPELPEADWDLLMAVNVKGVFLGLKYGMPALAQAGGGTI